MSAETITLVGPTGDVVDVAREDVAAFLNRGFVPEVSTARVERLGEEAKAARYDTLGSQILAGGAGLARGATLGLSDVAAGLLGSEGDVEALREVRKYNPNVSLGAEIIGGVAPALLSGGTGTVAQVARATPSGGLSAGAAALGEAVGAGGGAVRQVAGTALGAGAEGAVQNVGMYVSDVALENKKLSAEGFLASAGQGALWGGAAGGALGGIERGTIAARRLFPKSVAKDREAVQVIEDRFLASTNDAVTAGDDLEKVARASLDDLNIQRLELAVEREKIRTAGSLSPEQKVRLKEIDLERARIAAARKALRAERNAERAAAGLPDIPPEVAAPTPPPLDEASVVPTGPPANDVAPLAPANDVIPLAGVDDLESRLAAIKGLLDEGVPFTDIGAAAQGRIDDLSIAAQNTAHEAGMLADDAVQGSVDAAERLAQKTEDFAARKQAVKDWISKYQPGARNRFSSSLTGEDLAGGAPRRTDRTRILPEEGVEFEAQAGDRVFAGIGDDRTPGMAAAPNVRTYEAGGKTLRIEANVKKLPNGAEELQVTSYRTLGDGEEVESATASFAMREGELYPNNVTVEPAMQRKGVASQMYDLAETYTGRKIIPSATQTPEGKALSEAHRSRRSQVPDGWTADELFPSGPREIRRGVPAPDEVADDVAFVVKPSELAATGKVYGNPKTGAGTKQQIRDEWSRGEKLSPVDIQVDDSGRMFVYDGNHRLQVAAETDKPMLVRFTRGKNRGLKESDRILADSPAMKGAELDAAYDDLIERASNAADRAELTAIAKEAGALEEQILNRVASRGGADAEQVAKIRAKRAEYGWTADDVAARRAEKLAIAKSNDPVTPSAKMRAEQRDLDAFERVVRGNQGRADMAHSYPGATTKTLGEEILAKGGEAATSAPAPTGHPRDMGRFIADADEAIRVVGEFERAQYELAKELGPAAPPAIARHAEQYAAALDDQARKTTEAIAGKADDAVKNGNMPNPAALVSLPKAPAVAPAVTKKQVGRVADVAGMLELINSVGDIPFLPDPKNLPVIGPILGLYLKYRGLKAVYHRLGGRVPATSEARVAARSAEIRDRAADIADALLEGAGKAAKRGRGAVVVGGTKLTDVLKHELYPGAERKDEKTAQDAAKARIEELSRAAADPEGVRAAVREKVGAADPDLANAIADATLVKLQYLQKHAPKAPPPSMFGPRTWKLSTGEIERFARRVRAAEDPLTVLRDVERGTVTAEAAEALREVYPELFTEVQTRLLGRAAELEAKLPYQRVMSLSLLFDAPLDDSLRPQNLAVLQSAHASSAAQGPSPAAPGQPPQPPPPSVAGPVNISRLYETGDIRRAQRRG